MSYTINVSRGHKEIRRYGELMGKKVYAYEFYFRIYTDNFRKDAGYSSLNNLDDMVDELRSLYPSPKFKVSVSENKSYSEEIEI